MDLIFLDYDGILHPSAVWYERAARQVRLRAPGHELFESLPAFEAAIAPYPSLAIVLSTSWVKTFGFEHARERLPAPLQSRVIGATYDPQSNNAWRWDRMRRYDTIALDVQSRRPSRWLALDDDAIGWPVSELGSLVLAPGELGLACPVAQEMLRCRLAERFPKQ
jgi:HAD domain in Swiss Army Knife RNA repair proteins